MSSAGPEAIRLAESAGLTLDPWQGDFLNDALAEDEIGNWAAFECGLIVSRQNGKGSVLEARVLAGLNLFGDKLILWSAHETKTAFEGFRRCEELFTGSDALRKQVKSITTGNGKECIELRSGARLKFVARSKGSGRGFSADLVILDEAYALSPEQMAALIPTLSSRANPQIYYTSSPPLDGMSGGQLFALRERARKGADPSLVWYDYGLQDVDLDDLSGVDLGSPENWRLTNPSMGIVRSNGSRGITADFIAKERRTMPDADFARERLGIWPRQLLGGSAVIDQELWASLAELDAVRPDDVAFAVDINPARTHAAIAACGQREDGTLLTNVVDYRPGTAWIVPRLVELREKWSPVAIALDNKGPAGSLLLDLQNAKINPPADADRPRRGDLAVPTAGQAAAAFGLYVDAIRQKQLRHLDDAPLNQALAGAQTRPLAGGSAWSRAADTDICPLVASTLALWAYETRKHIKKTYDLLKSFY